MIQKLQTPETEMKNNYLDHKAYFDKQLQSWVVDDATLSNEDFLFYLCQGYPVTQITNLWIMYYLSSHSFASLLQHEQVALIKHLTINNKHPKDMDIPFGDFARIVDLFSTIDEDTFYENCSTALTSFERFTDDDLRTIFSNDLEIALFYYCFYK